MSGLSHHLCGVLRSSSRPAGTPRATVPQPRRPLNHFRPASHPRSSRCSRNGFGQTDRTAHRQPWRAAGVCRARMAMAMAASKPPPSPAALLFLLDTSPYSVNEDMSGARSRLDAMVRSSVGVGGHLTAPLAPHPLHMDTGLVIYGPCSAISRRAILRSPSNPDSSLGNGLSGQDAASERSPLRDTMAFTVRGEPQGAHLLTLHLGWPTRPACTAGKAPWPQHAANSPPARCICMRDCTPVLPQHTHGSLTLRWRRWRRRGRR